MTKAYKVILFLVLISAWHAKEIFAGEKYAMVLSTMASDESENRTLLGYVDLTTQILEKSGFKKNNIVYLIDGGTKTREGSLDCKKDIVLQETEALVKKVSGNDELWVFLFGNANSTDRGISITTRGPRLSGEDWAAALNKIQAPQSVFCLNRQSAPLMGLLKKDNRMVVTATNSSGQLNPPLFTDNFLKTWNENPTAPLLSVLSDAGEKTESYYKDNKIAVAEVSQFFDSKKLTSYPYKENPGSSNIGTALKESPREVLPSTSEPPPPPPIPPKKKSLSSKEMTVQPATQESQALLKTALDLSKNYLAFPAFYLQEHQDFIVNVNGSTTTTMKSSVYLIQQVAAEEFARVMLEDHPPHEEMEITSARIIYSDASFLQVQPHVHNAPNNQRFIEVEFPGAKDGCLLEMTYVTREPANIQIPWFSRMIPFQHQIPVASSRFQLSTPLKQQFHYKLYHNKTEPKISENNYSKISLFDFGAVPAFEPLPDDPPGGESLMRVSVSSLESWKSFADWTTRMREPAAAIDEFTRKLTKELTKNSKTDADKVQALYNFLSNLRYELKPVGVRAFRPRLPSTVCTERYGDCKDKANALVVMARELGITGYFALVNRGLFTDPENPAWQFNHAVAFFPKLEGYPNGLWLDSTDGSTSFPSLPPGDVGRQSFVMEPEPKFRQITLPSDMENQLFQTCQFQIARDRKVKGGIQIEARGLEGYSLRQSFKGLGPSRVKFNFQQLVTMTAPGLSVEAPNILYLQDLTKPILIEGKVIGSNWKLTSSKLLPPVDIWKHVANETRDRALYISDGQPTLIHQTVVVQDELANVEPIEWEQDSAWMKTSVSIQLTANGWNRESVLHLKQALIQPEDYPKFRAQILEWLSKMQ